MKTKELSKKGLLKRGVFALLLLLLLAISPQLSAARINARAATEGTETDSTIQMTAEPLGTHRKIN